MLQRPNADIAECYQHARQCAEYANAMSDLKAIYQFRLLEQGWLQMAHSIEFADRITAFIRREKSKAN